MSKIDELIARIAPNGIETKSLSDIATLVRGNGLPKTDLTDAGVGAIHYGQIYTRYGTWASETLSFVSPDTAAKLTKVDPGDIIITNTSENIEDVGKAVAWIGERQIVTGGHATVIKHHEDPKYLSYWFQSESFFAQKRALATGTKVIDVSARQLAKIRVPVPPLAIQQAVVDILDQFSQLEAGLAAELRSELSARRTQYEFHRAALLTFPESGDVKWVTMPDVAVNRDASRRPVTRSEREKGEYPYYGASGIVDYVSGYIFDGDYLLVSEDGANLLARSTPIAFSISGKAWVNNHAHILEFSTYDERRFVEIYLNSIDLGPFISGGAQPKLNQANLNKIPLPWPAASEQHRIVETLDRLDALVNELSADLRTELSARHKQYEHYRERLMNFEEAVF